MDPELQSELLSKAQQAVDAFTKAEAEYTEVLQDLEAELPEGFELLYDRLDARNVAVTTARKAVKAAHAKLKPFRAQVRKGLVFDEDTFVGLARELGCYEDLRKAGAIKYTISMKDIEDHVTPDVLTRLKETGRVVVKSVSVYGPKEKASLR